MSCPFREPINNTFKCKITQTECIVKVDTVFLSQESCEFRNAFKNLSIDNK